jgi:hypothetical protein
LSITEHHFSHRSGWLRAAVLGANDGIVSTAALVLGVAAAGAARADILLAGTAGLIAGAMSMAAGEYVSVSSQADTEAADLRRESTSLRDNSASELEELARIYEERGLDPALATEVARQLTAHDALSAHARDELGLFDMHAARPLQAAVTSAFTFAVRNRGRASATDHGAEFRRAAAYVGGARFARHTRVARHARRARRRRQPCQRRRARMFLGRACDGGHHRHWRAV